MQLHVRIQRKTKHCMQGVPELIVNLEKKVDNIAMNHNSNRKYRRKSKVSLYASFRVRNT